MPTIMSQNVVRPEDYKADTTAVSDKPLTSMDSHHLREHSSGNGRVVKNSTIASNSSQVAAMTAVMPTSKAPHSALSLGSRHHTKTRPLAIQTTSLHIISKSSDNNNKNNNINDNNNSNSHLNTANTESTPSSTTATPSSSTTPPPSTASSTSSTTGSPMSHIRRWTSSLSSSSKSNSKSTTKVRTIGPISAPQPLTTPVPYACTPLPYFDLPTPGHFPVSASVAQQCSPRSSLHSDATVPRSPAKPATSCPDLPVGPLASEYYSNVLTPIGTYSSLNRNQRTSWKDRLFNSNPKKQDRRASTNSNVDDDYEWSSNQKADASSNSATIATTTFSSSLTTPAAIATSSTEKQPTRSRVRISPPLTQPVLPANQKTVPIVQNPLISPTDDLFGPDTFDSFKIAPKRKAAASGPVSMMMMMTAPADEVVLSSACPSSAPSTPSEQRGRPTVDTQIKPPTAPAHQLLTPPSSHASEDSFPFASPTSSSSIDDEDNGEATGAPSETNGGKTSAKPEAAVLDFAASLCEGLVSDFVMPPSYFDQHNLSLAFEDAYPRADPGMMPKVVTDSSPPSSPPSPRSPVSSRSSQSKFSQKDRSLKSTSTYSTDSESSTSSIESEEESSDDESSLSPVSGASFFSTMPPSTGPAFKSYRSSALMKSGGIKIPSSLMTLLPTSSSNKSKTTAVSPSTTPPVSPPLAHAEIALGQMANLAPGGVGHTPPGMIMALADPRAIMLKRLAYIHTLRKLRERERRPFRHAVLLHLILLQLRRGITNKHCSEIAGFYVTMSAAQFPPRLDIANTMIMAQQQRSKLQQQQQLLSQQPSSSQIPFLASPIESVQESMIPVRSSSKAASTSTSTSGDKEPKSKRSLVFSLQSRSQANKSSSNINSGESGWSFNSSTTPAAATSVPSQISIFKERLPLLRIPTYPLINLERNSNNSNTTLTPSAACKNLAAAAVDSVSEDDQQGIEESNVDFQPGLVQQVPTVILPKRTTGRKGLLYQQQLQLRMRQQMSMIGGNGSADQVTGVSEQDQAWLQSQLVGTRPRFATSTFTTVRSGRSDVVTRPLVPLATVKTPPATSESSSAWSSFPFAPFGHRSQTTASTSTSATASITSTGAITSASQDGNGSLHAGLLTPPLSPLFRNPFSAATSTSTATPAASTGSVNTTNNNSNINTSTPPPLPPTAILTTNNSNSKRESYTAQGHHSPPSSSAATFPSHHTRVVSAGSVSSYTLPHTQNSHHTISYLEGQAVQARSRSSFEGHSSGRASPPPLPTSSASSLSCKQQQQQQKQLGLPSPPLSPTLDADGNAAAMLSTASASMSPSVQSAKRSNLPQRYLSNGGYYVQQLGMMMGGGNNGGSAADGVVGGRSENIAWNMRAPSPVNQHDLQTRHSMEDTRNRRHWKASSSSTPTATSPPAVASASAAAASPTAMTVNGPTSKKSLKSAKGGVFSPEESEEEEDVPLAFVQRRISSDTLRSMA